MNADPHNENGKVLVVILWIVGVIILLAVFSVTLIVTGAIKFPASSVEWPAIGSFIAQYGEIIEEEPEENTEGLRVPGVSDPEGVKKLSEDPTAIYIRDISLKSQQIEDLNGQLEARGDKIAELEEEIQGFRTQLEHYKPENRKALIAIYDRMEASAATEILSQLTPERAVIILSSLKDSKAAEILEGMDADTAFRITQLMAGFQPESIKDIGTLKGRRTSTDPQPQPPSDTGPAEPGPPIPDEIVGPAIPDQTDETNEDGT